MPAPRTNGLAITSLVLSLVGLIPCFWFVQVPGLLGAIFGVVARRQVRSSEGRQGGSGLAIAGLVVGLVLVALCAVFWLWLVVAGDCERTNGGFRCST